MLSPAGKREERREFRETSFAGFGEGRGATERGRRRWGYPATPASISGAPSGYSDPLGFAVRVDDPEPLLGAYPPSDEGPREPEAEPDGPELLRGLDDGPSDSLPEPRRGVA